MKKAKLPKVKKYVKGKIDIFKFKKKEKKWEQVKV